MTNRISRIKFTRYIRGLRPDLFILFIISISSIFLIDLWLINIPELFRGGGKIGLIVYNLSLSYVSAFIFYFLVVHLKNQKDKENLYSYISQKTLSIINQAKTVIDASSQISKTTLKDTYPDKFELNKICKAINPYSNSPLVLGRINNYANWFQYFGFYSKKSNEASVKILSKLQYLESELVDKLAKIEDCQFFNTISFYNSVQQIQVLDMTVFEAELFEYLNLIQDLERYYNKELKNYK